MSSERIFQKEDGRWYFRIRGNTSMGPYTNHREANDSLNRYVASCQRQAEMSLTWPRWLHVKYWARRFNEAQHQPTATRARQA